MHALGMPHATTACIGVALAGGALGWGRHRLHGEIGWRDHERVRAMPNGWRSLPIRLKGAVSLSMSSFWWAYGGVKGSRSGI